MPKSPPSNDIKAFMDLCNVQDIAPLATGISDTIRESPRFFTPLKINVDLANIFSRKVKLNWVQFQLQEINRD